MSANEKPRFETLALAPAEAPEPWESWVVELKAFPAPDPQAKALRGWLERLAGELLKTAGLSPSAALQVNELHLGDGAALVQEKAVEWMPQIGLGVFPDRDPPKPWTEADFEAVEIQAEVSVRPLMHQVLVIGTGSVGVASARAEMPGRGAYVEMHGLRKDEELLTALTAASQDKLVDPMFKGFPFLFPLLDGQSFAALSIEQLEQRTAGAQFYARDSPSDGGLLLARKGGFSDVFAALGGERQSNGKWNFEWPIG